MWDKIRQQWVKNLLGEEKTALKSNKILKNMMEQADAKAKNDANTMRLNGDNLWDDIAWDASENLTEAYRRVACIAQCYATYASKLYLNVEIKKRILFAIEWLYQNRYGNNVLRGDGWRNPGMFNWWDWAIGAPAALINTLMLVYDELSYEQICDYLKAFDVYVPQVKDYGANRLNFAQLKIGSAILRKDREMVLICLSAIENLFIYCDNGENDGQGMYSDGTYIFHTKHPMNGIYGLDFMRQAVKLAGILKTTEFAFSDTIEKRIVEWFEMGYINIAPYGSLVRMMNGRHLRTENSGEQVIRLGINCLKLQPENLRIKAFLKDGICNFPLGKAENVSGKVAAYFAQNPDSIQIIDDIINDSALPKAREEFSKTFYFCDKVIHQRSSYTFTVSMSSSRIYNYECINNENMTGWYIGDGMTSLYNKANTYTGDYWKAINPYYIPGTTVDSQQRKAVSIRQSNEYLSGQDFVGGATLDNQYTVCALALESYHSDGKFSSDDKFPNQPAEYGVAPPKHECSLTAKKAWFMFDDEIVCLGADISSTDNSNVRTVVYNNKNDLKCIDNTVCIDTHCAIEFLDHTPYEYKTENGFSILSVEHGKNPNSEKYAYIVYPSGNINDDVEILSNDKTVQAVRQNKLGLAQYVFWSASKSGNVSSSAPCLAVVSEDKIAACDPTHKNTTIDITIDDEIYRFDFKGANGKTITFERKNNTNVLE